MEALAKRREMAYVEPLGVICISSTQFEAVLGL